MKKSERVKAVQSIMKLVHQYGCCNYLQPQHEKDRNEERYLYLLNEEHNLSKIIEYEIYALIDELDRQKEKED